MRQKFIEQQHQLSRDKLIALFNQLKADTTAITTVFNPNSAHDGYINGSPYALKLLVHKHDAFPTQFIPVDRFNKLIELFRKKQVSNFDDKGGVSPFLKQPACLYILSFIDNYYLVIDLLKANPATMVKTLGRTNERTGIATLNYELPNRLATKYRLNMLHSNLNLKTT